MKRMNRGMGSALKLLGDRRGSVALLTGLGFLMMVVMVGIAVDVSRGHTLKAKLSSALDAAGLAGGAVASSSDIGTKINEYFNVNFPPGFMGATVDGPHYQLSNDKKILSLNATAQINTLFVQLIGYDTITVAASSEVTREHRGMELVLVMDNTGSMRSGGKIDAMKTAAQSLIDILYGGKETIPHFWVGLVPYAATVNIGSQHYDWLTNPYTYTDHTGTHTRSLVSTTGDDGDSDTMNILDNSDPDSAFYPTRWKGCVEARAYPEDTTDNLPSSGGYWKPHFWAEADVDNDWYDEDNDTYDIDESNGAQNNGTGPNLGCGPAITPLIKSKTTITNAISEMQPWHRGGTLSNLGMAWGWRVVSPKWRGLWGGDNNADMPLDYDEPLMNKVVILLTDGVNQFYDHGGDGELLGSDYSAYGRLGENRLGSTNIGTIPSIVNNRLLETCAAMKQEGVLIYSITFRLNNSATQQVFRDCASDPTYYFNSPSNEDLQLVFQAIADSLANLRLSK